MYDTFISHVHTFTLTYRIRQPNIGASSFRVYVEWQVSLCSVVNRHSNRLLGQTYTSYSGPHTKDGVYTSHKEHYTIKLFKLQEDNPFHYTFFYSFTFFDSYS